jgi:hypothetical protein
MLRRAGQSTDLDNLSVLSGMDNVIIHPKTKQAPCAGLTVNINREVPNLGCVGPAAIHIFVWRADPINEAHSHL